MPQQNDFLQALKEDMPADFAQDLREQLRTIEQQDMPIQQTTSSSRSSSWWVLAVACFGTVLLGMILFSSRINTLDVLNIAPWIPEPITSDNVAELRTVASADDGFAYEIALSHDETTLAILSTTGFYLQPAHDLNADAQFIGLPDMQDGEQVRHFEYSSDNRLLVFTFGDHVYTLHEWDTEIQTFVELYQRTFPRGVGADFPIAFNYVDIHPDGTQLALGYCVQGGEYLLIGGVMRSHMRCGDASDSYISITDVSQIDSADSTVAESTVFDLRFSDAPHGVVTVNSTWTRIAYIHNNMIVLHDIETGESQEVIRVNLDRNRPAQQTTLTFSADGSYLAYSGALDGEIAIWSVDDLLQADEPLSNRVVSDVWSSISYAEMIFHPQTNDLIVPESNRIIVKSPDDLRRIGLFASSWRTVDIALTTDGTTLYGLSDTGFLQAWSWDERNLLDSTDRFGASLFTEFVFSPDGSYFVNHSDLYGTGLSYLWQIEDDTITRERFARSDEIMLAMPLDAVAISDDGRFIAHVQYSELYVYDRELYTHTRAASASFLVNMTFTSDGSLMVVDTSRTRATIRTISRDDLLSGEITYHTQEGITLEAIRPSPFGFSNSFTNAPLAFSPDGNYLIGYHCASTGTLMNIVFYDTNQSCEESAIVVIDTATGEVLGNLLELQTDFHVRALSVSQDGRYVSVAYCEQALIETGHWCHDETYQVDVWRIEDFASLTLEMPLMPFAQFVALPNVESIALVPTEDSDNLLLATSGWVQSTFPTDGERVTQFWILNAEGETEQVYELDAYKPTFSPDGSLMVGVADNQVQVWQIPIEALLRADS